jgi:hypothetical protein
VIIDENAIPEPTRPSRFSVRHKRTQPITRYSPMRYWGSVFCHPARGTPYVMYDYVFTPVTFRCDLTPISNGRPNGGPPSQAKSVLDTITGLIRTHYGRNANSYKPQPKRSRYAKLARYSEPEAFSRNGH